MVRNYAWGLFLLVGASAHAAQIYSLNEEHEIKIEVSNTELNRIIVEKDRISDVFAHEATLEILPDERLGQIFVRTSSSPQGGLRLTLTTEEGRVQDIRLLSQDIQGQTVLLRENAEIRTKEKLQSEQDTLVEILSVFLSGTVPPGFKLNETHEGRQLYLSEQYTVEVFTHHNTSENVVILDEEMFVSSPQTRAILMACSFLNPDQTTLIWRVISHD